MTLLGDSRLARATIPSAHDAGFIQIFEGNDSEWTMVASIPSTGWFPGNPQQMQFVDENRLLVAASDYSSASHSRCGGIAQIERQGDGSWAFTEMILAPAPRTSGFFAEDFAYEAGGLIVSERGYDPPSRVFYYKESSDGFVWDQTLDFSSVEYASNLQGWDVALRGDRALFAANEFYVFERTSGGSWALSDAVTSTYIHSAPFLMPDGDLMAYLGGSPTTEGAIESWKRNSQGDLEWDGIRFCWIGSRTRHDVPMDIDSNQKWNAVRTSEPSTNQPRVVLFGPDAKGESVAMSGVTVPSPYALEGFSLSEQSLALVVRDTSFGWDSGAGWETWMVPVQTVKPVGNPLIPLRVETQLKPNSAMIPRFTARIREVQAPVHRVTILYSIDLENWFEYVPGNSERTVVDPDADGDGKVSLIEFSLPVEMSGNDEVYYRFVESETEK